jgi:hypothetical protein
MAKTMSEALGEVLALVEKATPGELQASETDGYFCVHRDITTPGGAGFLTDSEAWKMEDAEAVAAAINFLRQHGAALSDLARRVEGDAQDAERYRWLRDEAHKAKGMSPAVIYATENFDVSSDECGGFEYGADLDAAIDQARGLPLDAGEGVEGG